MTEYHKLIDALCRIHTGWSGERDGADYYDYCTAEAIVSAHSHAVKGTFYQTREVRLEAALKKLVSYNEDVAAGKINYRPEDHIEVANAAISLLRS